MHQHRFADSRLARDQNQFRTAPRRHAVEGAMQARDLALAAVKLLGNDKPVRRVVLAESKLWAFPLHPCTPQTPQILIQAASQVRLESSCGLVALLRGLSEQLHDDPRHSSRNALHTS